MNNLKHLKDQDLSGKRVLVRVAYDVPLIRRGAHTIIADDSRIVATLPTLKYLLKKKCVLVLATWMGRPDGKVVDSLRVTPVAKRLSELLHVPVQKLDDCIGPVVEQAIGRAQGKQVLMLENVRFHPEEDRGDSTFATKLVGACDHIVFEAFAQSHRDVASTTGILSKRPCSVGFSMEEELTQLSRLKDRPRAPFVVILGGAKISDKIETLLYLLESADVVLVGGAMAHSFLKAQGLKIGSSLVEEETARGSKKIKQGLFTHADEIMRKTAGKYLNMARGLNVPKLVLPLDLVAASRRESRAKTVTVSLKGTDTIPWDWMYLDIGPATVATFSEIIKYARTIFWNGPLGYTELEPFRSGTRAIARAVAESRARTFLGGGDTEAFVRGERFQKKYDFISTGGGASLAFLSSRELPVMKFLRHK